MIHLSHILDLADAFQAAGCVEDKTLSFWVFGDSKKLTALRGGADLTTKRYNAALLWFSDNWPAGAEWPEGIARPAAQQAEAAHG